jgi:hypothetical protein
MFGGGSDRCSHGVLLRSATCFRALGARAALSDIPVAVAEQGSPEANWRCRFRRLKRQCRTRRRVSDMRRVRAGRGWLRVLARTATRSARAS